jgi:uncharacterized protein (DUF488 family)
MSVRVPDRLGRFFRNSSNRPATWHLNIDYTVSIQLATLQESSYPCSGDFCDVADPLNLYTLGYQGVDVDTYVQRLKSAGVGIVADVRETPWSHKRGFCKNILSAELSKSGIEYIHVKSAGNPKENRRTAIDMADCLRRYRDYLNNNPAGITDLIQVIRTAAASNRTVCLTCFERDVHDCHRSILVDAMRRQIRIRPVHL